MVRHAFSLRFRAWAWSVCLLATGYPIASAHAQRPPPPPPAVFSPTTPESLEKDLATQRDKASKTKTSVTRRFIVGWEFHHGYYFVPTNDLSEIVMPDFLDARTQALFDEHKEVIVRRLICTCVGIEWSFYGTRRFIVREARMEGVAQ